MVGQIFKWTPQMTRVLLDDLDQYSGEAGLFVTDQTTAFNNVIQHLQQCSPQVVVSQKQVSEKLRTLKRSCGISKKVDFTTLFKQGLGALRLEKLPKGIYTAEELANRKRKEARSVRKREHKPFHKSVKSSRLPTKASTDKDSSSLSSTANLSDMEVLETSPIIVREAASSSMTPEAHDVNNLIQNSTSTPIAPNEIRVSQFEDTDMRPQESQLADNLHRLTRFIDDNAIFKTHLNRRTIQETCQHLNDCIKTAVLERLAGVKINCDQLIVLDLDRYSKELLNLLQTVGGAECSELSSKFGRIAACKRLTLATLLRAIIGAALTEWVFEPNPQGEETSDLFLGVKNIWDDLAPSASMLVYKLAVTKYLETRVKPHIVQQAVHLTHALDKLLTPLLDPPYFRLKQDQQLNIVSATYPNLRGVFTSDVTGSSEGNPMPCPFASKWLKQWHSTLQDIFSRALHLRLEMEKDHGEYTFTFPPCGATFKDTEHSPPRTKTSGNMSRIVFMPFMPLIHGSYRYYLHGPEESNKLLSPGCIDFVDIETAGTQTNDLRVPTELDRGYESRMSGKLVTPDDRATIGELNRTIVKYLSSEQGTSNEKGAVLKHKIACQHNTDHSDVTSEHDNVASADTDNNKGDRNTNEQANSTAYEGDIDSETDMMDGVEVVDRYEGFEGFDTHEGSEISHGMDRTQTPVREDTFGVSCEDNFMSNPANAIYKAYKNDMLNSDVISNKGDAISEDSITDSDSRVDSNDKPRKTGTGHETDAEGSRRSPTESSPESYADGSDDNPSTRIVDFQGLLPGIQEFFPPRRGNELRRLGRHS